MKKIIYFLLSLTPLLFSSCGDDDKAPSLNPTERGTVTDNLGNTYEWVRIGDLLWTTSNAKNGPDVWECEYYNLQEWTHIFESYGYPDDELIEDYCTNYIPVYGNLMNYAGAVASAPDGWRLPTDEDWQKLERALGMSNTDSRGMRGNKEALRLQEKGCGTELAMQLGGAFLYEPAYGWVDLSLRFEEVYGYYWTATIDPANQDEEMAYFRKFFSGSGKIWRESTSTLQLMSVRWVRDAK